MGLALSLSTLAWFTGTSFAAVSAPTINSPKDGYSSVNRMPVFSGTVVAGETVRLDIDGTTVATVSNSSGNWSLTPSAPLAVGQHSVIAIGCVSGSCAASSSQQLNELPSTPVISDPASGSSSAVQTPTVSGTADAGDTITLYSTDSLLPLGTAIAGDDSGAWSLTLTSALVPDGYGVYVVATDPDSGLQSGDSDIDDFTVLPQAPVITSPHSNVTLTTAATAPTTQVCGTAAVGETVAVTVNGNDAGSTSGGPSGTWCITAATPHGVDTLVAFGTDASGGENASAAIAIAIVTPSSTVGPTIKPTAKQKLTLTLTNALKVKCALSPDTIKSCTVTIKASGKVIGKATATFKNSKTHSATVTVKLSKSAVKLVKKAGKKGLKVNVTMVLSAVGGSVYTAAGTSVVTK